MIADFELPSSKNDFQKLLATSQEMKCEWVYNDDNGTYIMSPICLIKREFPRIDFARAVDAVWDDIITFDAVYDLDETEFSYTSTQPRFVETNKYDYYDGSYANFYFLYTLAKK